MVNKYIKIGSDTMDIDEFELQQVEEGKKIIFVNRTVDTNSSKIFNVIDTEQSSIVIGSPIDSKNAMLFDTKNAIIQNYQYITEGENTPKEFFQVKGSSTTVSMAAMQSGS